MSGWDETRPHSVVFNQLVDLNVGASAQEVLRRVAKAIPTQISAVGIQCLCCFNIRETQ